MMPFGSVGHHFLPLRKTNMSELYLRGHSYVPNGIHNQVLLQLSLLPKGAGGLWEDLVHPLKRMISFSDFKTDCLGTLEAEGHITLTGSEYSLTPEGRAMLNFLASQSVKPQTLTVAAKKEYTVPTGFYQGEELRISTFRRGAYDFLALPSLYGSEYKSHPTAHLAREQDHATYKLHDSNG